MLKQQKPVDPAQERRLNTGFPADAGFWMRGLLLLSLAAMLAFRRKLGERTVGLFKLIALTSVMLLWSLIVAALVSDGQRRAFLTTLFVGIGISFGFLLLGLGQRFVRWIMWQRGEQLATLSLGISVLLPGVPNANAERYIDPLLSIGLGVFLCSAYGPEGSASFGSWMVLSGLALLGIEKFMHERDQTRRDAFIASREDERDTMMYLRERGVRSGKEERTATEVPTGLDPALAERVAQRQKARQQASGSDATIPASMREPQPRQVGSTVPVSSVDDSPAASVAPSAAARDALHSKPSGTEGVTSNWAVVIAIVIGVVVVFLLLESRLKAKAPPRLAQVEMSLTAQTSEVTSVAVPEPKQVTQPPSAQADAVAFTRRGNDHYFGQNSTVQNLAVARGLYQRAAEMGDAEAQTRLALMYEDAEGGLTKNDALALQWLKKAADQGYAPGQSRLADLYRWGTGVEHDEPKAAHWYRKAAMAGDARGQTGLGFMYRQGVGGLPESPETAAQWWEKAAAGGNAQAQVMLGLMYSQGVGVEQDDRKAVEYFRLAAEQEDSLGLFHLGAVYEAGKGGLQVNEQVAAGLYMKSADQGHGDAQVALALMYLQGKGGLTTDSVKAVALLKQAAAQDNAKGQKALAVLVQFARDGDAGAARALKANGVSY